MSWVGIAIPLRGADRLPHRVGGGAPWNARRSRAPTAPPSKSPTAVHLDSFSESGRLKSARIGTNRGSYMSDKNDGAWPQPDGGGRTPIGVWFMLAIFVVGIIALFVMGNVEV